MIQKTLVLLILASFTMTLEQEWETQSEYSDVDFENAEVRTQNIVARPQVITERYSQSPKIITERVVGQPKIVTEEVIEPLRQRIIVAPRVNNQVEQLVPKFVRGSDQYQESDI